MRGLPLDALGKPSGGAQAFLADPGLGVGEGLFEAVEELVELGFDRATVERVDRMVSAAEFKRQVPPIAKLTPRTPGIDYLYPRRRPGSKRG